MTKRRRILWHPTQAQTGLEWGSPSRINAGAPPLSCVVSFLDQAESNFLSLASQQLVLLSLKPVVIHEEIPDLVQPLEGRSFSLQMLAFMWFTSATYGRTVPNGICLYVSRIILLLIVHSVGAFSGGRYVIRAGGL